MKINSYLKMLLMVPIFAGSYAHAACSAGAIEITSLPFTANTSDRTYCLTKNLTYNATKLKGFTPIQFLVPSYAAITIKAKNVILDLNGKSLAATNLLKDEGAIGIYAGSKIEKVTVMNGKINGFDVGVVAHAKQEAVVRSVAISNGKFMGISATGDVVTINKNSISKLNSRWVKYMSVIDVGRSKTANIYDNNISTVRALNASPSSDLSAFYGAHGISIISYEKLNIYNNKLLDLATTKGEFSYISFFNSDQAANGLANIYGNTFSYDLSHTASKEENLGMFMYKDNYINLYLNEYIGFENGVISAPYENHITSFNNIFHRYKVDGVYKPLFPSGAPIDAGGNEIIYH